MMFMIALYMTTYSLLASTEAMIGDAFSMVRKDGDSVPLCAIDEPSAVKSTISVIWCGIECMTSSSSSTCHSFSYFETSNKCDIFFFPPTNYAVQDDCITYGPMGSEVQGNPTIVSTDATQPVILASSTAADAIVASAADFTAASASEIASSAANAISMTGPTVTPLASATANVPGISSAQQTAVAAAASSISAVGPATAAAAAPTQSIPDAISTPGAPASPSTIDTRGASSAAAAAAATIALEITTKGSTGQSVQPITTTPAKPLTVAPPPTPPPTVLACEKNIGKPFRRLMQQNTGGGLDKSWDEYKYGFNDGNGGYWIGNEILYRMTNNGTTCRLCIDMQMKLPIPSMWNYALYSSFVIGSETDGYNYTATGFSGDVTNTFGLTNSYVKFSAKDHNSQPPCPDSATSLKGGWWYPCSATQIVLNGNGPPGFFWADPKVMGGRILQTSYMWIICP